MKHLLISLIVLTAYVAHSQTFDWAKQGHYSGQNKSECVGTDKAGNVYISGLFIPDYNNYYGNTWGGIISKYTSGGALLWTDTLPNVLDIHSVVDSLGNIYITGYFGGVATFGSTTYTASTYGGYTAKYNSNGQCLWSKNSWGYKIAFHPAGGFYTTMGYYGYGMAYPQLLNRYDANGNLIWSANATFQNASSVCFSSDVSTDRFGNSYITGEYTDTVTIGSGSNAQTLIYNGPFNNIFIAKYDTHGNLVWVRYPTASYYGFERQFPFYISTEPCGNSIVAGNFMTSMTLGGNSYTVTTNSMCMILAKYDPSGNMLWSTAMNQVPDVTTTSVKHDHSYNNFYLTGAIFGNLNFGNNVAASSPSASTAFALRLDSNAVPQAITHPVSLGTTYGRGKSNCYNVYAPNDSILYMVGIVYDSTTAFGNTHLSSPEYPDLLLAKVKIPYAPLAIGELQFSRAAGFVIYPNPTSGLLYLAADEKNSKYRLSVKSALGELVSQYATLPESIDLSQLARGVYFIEIVSDKIREVKKVVVE